MRARNQDDGLETLLLTWGGWAADLALMQTSAAAIIAAEIDADPDRRGERTPQEASMENYRNPTQANVAALSSRQWRKLYTLHNAILQLNRLWRDLVRLRYQKRMGWEEIEGKLNLDERSRKVCMTLIRRELRIDLGASGFF